MQQAPILSNTPEKRKKNKHKPKRKRVSCQSIRSGYENSNKNKEKKSQMIDKKVASKMKTAWFRKPTSIGH
jgi:hypothetical protein